MEDTYGYVMPPVTMHACLATGRDGQARYG